MSLVPFICDRPWLITPTALEMILAVAEREEITPELVQSYHKDRGPSGGRVSMLASQAGEKVQGSRNLRMRKGGVGVISLIGPIIRYANFFDEMSDGATSLQSFMKDLDLAMEHPDIRSIVMEVDSPGGEANSIHDAAYAIRRANDRKPITAFATFLDASAALFLSAGAGRIVASPTSFLGSIGAAGEWIKTNVDQKMGITRERFVSSVSPEKGPEFGSDPWRAQCQAQVDFLGSDFADSMADLLKVSRKKVLQDFGRGGVLNAKQALEVGMIHDIGDFEGVVASMAGGRRYHRGDAERFLKMDGGDAVPKFWELFQKKVQAGASHDELEKLGEVEVVVPGEMAATPPASPAPEGRRGPDPETVKLRDEIRDLKIDALVTTLRREERIDPVEEEAVRGRLLAAWNLDGRHGLSGPDSSYGLLEATLKARPRGMMKEEVSVDKPLPGRRQVGHEDKVTEEDPNLAVLDRISNQMSGTGKSNGAVK